MPQALEQRVEQLEKSIYELQEQVLRLQHPRKDWRATVGSLPDDDLSRDAERLGREYRQQQTYEREIADS